MTEQLEVLRTVVQGLEALGIDYMLSGSLAMTHYAQPRMTRDMDIVIELTSDDAEAFARHFMDTFYVDVEMIQEAAAHRSMFNLIHLATMQKVDCIVRKDEPYRLEEFHRRRRVSFGVVDVWIVSPEDLVLSKLAWAKDSRSEMQMRDVRNLVQSVPLDWAYLQEWGARLTVAELLREVHDARHEA